MICKNCLHYKACKGTYDILDTTCSGEFDYEEFARSCKNFTNRSEWVHLPCYIGDTVYITYDGDYGEYKITEMNIDSLGKLKVMVECSIHGYGRIGLCPKIFCGQPFCSAHLSADEFRKTAFLTREEAEKALEERNERTK